MIENDILIVKLFKFFPDYISTLKRKLLMVFVVILLGGVLGVIYATTKPNKFVAIATFFCESESGNSLSGYAGIASQFGIDIGGSSSGIFSSDNIIELLKSKKQIKATLLCNYTKDELLIDEYLKMNKIKTKNEKIEKNENEQIKFNTIKNIILKDSLLEIAAINIIKENISVDKKNKNTDLTQIKFISQNQFFAKKFVEELISITTAYYIKYKTQKGQYNIDVIQTQVDSVRKMLFGGINEVADLNDLNVNPLKQKMKTSAQKSQSQLQVNSVLYTELLKNLELAKLSLRKDTPLIQVIDSPIIPMKNEKMGRLLMGIIFSFSFLLLFFFVDYSKFVRNKLF